MSGAERRCASPSSPARNPAICSAPTSSRRSRAMSGRPVELVGVGGRHLQGAGADSRCSTPSEIALMGVTADLRDLPRLIRRIGQTARAIVAAQAGLPGHHRQPGFRLRVARKVRAADPTIPIVHYVCPSVWAWRPGRAPAMRPYVDHVLCLLPFEPAELARLGGPPGTFVGHRLTHEPGMLAAAEAQRQRSAPAGDGVKTLLVLPGSRKRRGEPADRAVRRDAATSCARAATGCGCCCRPCRMCRAMVEAATARLAGASPRSSPTPTRKWQAFGEADAALAPPARYRWNWRLPACRWSPATSSTGSARRLQRS